MPRHADRRSIADQRTGATAQLQKLGKRTWLIVGGIGVVVALITGILQLSEQVSKRPSTTDRVEMEATSLANFGYAVRVNAPFNEMPLTFVRDRSGSGYECSPELLDWLGSHGRKYDEWFRVSLRSTADSGARITVKDFTTKGTLTTPAIPWVRVICGLPVGAAISSQLGSLQTSPGSTAAFDDLAGLIGEAVKQPEGGSPVLYELEPGEPATIQLKLSTDEDFEGSLMATVASGDDTKEVVIPVKGQEKIFVPSFRRMDYFRVRIVPPFSGNAGFMECILVKDGRDNPFNCSGEDLVDIFSHGGWLVQR